LVHLIVELDRCGEWALDGSRTCAHWVAAALDVEVATVREWLRIGKSLARLPLIDTAFAERRVSFTQVRLLTRIADAETEEELLSIAESTSAGRLSTELARWLSRREDPESTEARQQEARGLTWRTEPDGMVVGTLRLPPNSAAILMTAVDTLVMRAQAAGPAPHPMSPNPSDPAARSERAAPESPGAAATEGGVPATAVASPPLSVAGSTPHWASVGQQRADALMSLLDGSASVQTEVVLHVRGDGCTLDDGTPIASSVVERIAPESFIRLLIHDAQRGPVNASGRRRHPTTRQKRVVHERDGGCVDCGATALLEFDHQPEFALTGRTVTHELRQRCWMCHRARHAQQPTA
jgi:hypothetical protein